MEIEAIAEVLGGRKVLGKAIKNPDDLAQLVRTGLPASCIIQGSDAAINTVGRETDYCDAIAGINANNGPHRRDQWWDITGFSLPTDAEVFGDAGRSTLRGPKFVTFDFSAMKTTKLTERLALQFRFEAFNFFNHPVLGIPSPVLDTYPNLDPVTRRPVPTAIDNGALGSVFGSIGHTAADNRQLQFALKFIW